MAPRTSEELVEWELPALGMNSDTSAVNIPVNQAALINNYITGEPGQMRLRQGFKTASWTARSSFTATGGYGEVGGSPLSQTYYGSQTTDLDVDKSVCLGVAVYGDQALVTFGNYGGSLPFRGDWLFGFPNNYPGATQSLAVRTYILFSPSGVINTTLFDPLGTGTGTEDQKLWQQSMNIDGGGTTPPGPPFPAVSGHGVPFDERVFFVCPTVYGMWGHKPIMSWAGCGGAASIGTAPANTNGYLNAVSIKVNNGEYTIDLSNEVSNIQNMIASSGALIVPKVNGAGGTNGTATTAKEAYYVYKMTTPLPGVIFGGSAFTQEYGRGAVVGTVPNETPASGATRNFRLQPVAPVLNGPYGANHVNEFQGRLFALGGTRASRVFPLADMSSTYNMYSGRSLLSNIVQWSSGIAEDWPEQNFFFIDDASNDVLMSSGTISDLQVICTKNNTYVMSGYDEDSFQLDNLMRHDGCADHRSMRNIEGRLYWLGLEGLWSWGGAGLPVRESHPRSGVGIRSDIKQQRDKITTSTNYPYTIHTALGRSRDRLLFVNVYGVPSSGLGATYTYYPASGAFSRLQMDTYYHYVQSPSTTQRMQVPQFFFDFQGRNYAVGSTTVWDVTNLFDEVSTAAGDDAPLEHVTLDQYRTTADGAGTVDIGGRIQFRDFVVRPGRTVRVKEMAVEHSIQHDGTNAAVDVTLGVDHSQTTQSSTIKTLQARDYNGAGTVEFDNGRYFVDRIVVDGMSLSPEGQVFRVKFDKPATSGYRNDGGHKLYRFYGMLEVTRNLRVDSTG